MVVVCLICCPSSSLSGGCWIGVMVEYEFERELVGVRRGLFGLEDLMSTMMQYVVGKVCYRVQ